MGLGYSVNYVGCDRGVAWPLEGALSPLKAVWARDGSLAQSPSILYLA